jgi:hypothetical protein
MPIAQGAHDNDKSTVSESCFCRAVPVGDALRRRDEPIVVHADGVHTGQKPTRLFESAMAVKDVAYIAKHHELVDALFDQPLQGFTETVDVFMNVGSQSEFHFALSSLDCDPVNCGPMRLTTKDTNYAKADGRKEDRKIGDRKMTDERINRSDFLAFSCPC